MKFKILKIRRYFMPVFHDGNKYKVTVSVEVPKGDKTVWKRTTVGISSSYEPDEQNFTEAVGYAVDEKFTRKSRIEEYKKAVKAQYEGKVFET